MRVLLRLVTLLIAVTSAGLSAAEASAVCAPASVSGASSHAVSASAETSVPRAVWTMADVDGDRVDDLVRVAADSRQAAAPEIVGPGCRVVASTSAIARVLDGTLAALDLDADHDLDLVHLDAAGRPLRAWLNDGHGAFQVASGDVARGRVPFASYRRTPSSTLSRVDAWHASHGLTPGIAPAGSRAEEPRPTSTLPIADVPLVCSIAWHSAVTRGPPSLS